MSDLIRTFVALELDLAARRALGSLQSKLKQELGVNAVRWVAPENIHITLKFLGDIVRTEIPALEQAIAETSVGVSPFELRFSGVGAFPNANRPNVIWVGAQGDLEMAAALAGKIEIACRALGYLREEHPFEPHLTLGRIKRDSGARERAEIARMIAAAPTREVGSCTFTSVSVMKSELRPTGSVYSQLAVIKLS